MVVAAVAAVVVVAVAAGAAAPCLVSQLSTSRLPQRSALHPGPSEFIIRRV